jgi:hypothetical protein
MRYAYIVLVFGCCLAQAEQVSVSSGFSVGPDGISIGTSGGASGSGRDIAISSQNGQITLQTSISRTLSRVIDPAPRPVGVPAAPLPPALTDSDTFFRGVGVPRQPANER